ncbi:IS5 family transposase [Streptomyces sp. NPDC056503]|uniref:IS5 family transposase n=1 Tax=Streptomyces sp. NPDC056503 TaxID=3345842 RepID=UPI0036D132AB
METRIPLQAVRRVRAEGSAVAVELTAPAGTTPAVHWVDAMSEAAATVFADAVNATLPDRAEEARESADGSALVTVRALTEPEQDRTGGRACSGSGPGPSPSWPSCSPWPSGRTVVPWRGLPCEYGPWQTVYGLFRRWQRQGVWARLLTLLQARADAAGPIAWEVNVDCTVCRDHRHAAGARRDGAEQQEPPGGVGHEPDDHGLGRSRGGFTTKIHLACEQGQKPLSLLVTAGQRGDSPQFEPVLKAIQVPRPGAGRPRTRPLRVRGDRAYSSRANRAYLRRRGIRCTIPEPAGQARNRKSRGRTGGRPGDPDAGGILAGSSRTTMSTAAHVCDGRPFVRGERPCADSRRPTSRRPRSPARSAVTPALPVRVMNVLDLGSCPSSTPPLSRRYEPA